MKNIRVLLLLCLILACNNQHNIQQLGKDYQHNNTYANLKKVVDKMPLQVDTTYIKNILGEPINMGFDYRYTTDSIGPDSCTIGAVFHIDEKGKIDNVMLDQICE